MSMGQKNQDELVAKRVVAVVRANTADQAFLAGQAAYRGGIRALEITFTVPRAESAIARLREALPIDALVGAGTITETAQAERAKAAGAQFFVSPHVDEALIAWHLERKLAYLPGGMTPTELMRAERAGCRLVKLFPANVGGPGLVKAILAALPQLSLMVTGGVDEKTAPEFLHAGAEIVCVGGSVISAEAIAAGDYGRIEAACRRVVDAVQARHAK